MDAFYTAKENLRYQKEFHDEYDLAHVKRVH